MKNTEELIKTFYNSFAKRDFQSMQKCYHEDSQFSDPVFPNLKGKQINAMWHMLCESGKDLIIDYSGVGAYGNSAKANWRAVYTFSKTGRIVHNEINATFVLKDNLIISHRDDFNFWKWSKMALGTTGSILGWSDYLKNNVRNNANKQLKKFIEHHPVYK